MPKNKAVPAGLLKIFPENSLGVETTGSMAFTPHLHSFKGCNTKTRKLYTPLKNSYFLLKERLKSK